MKKPTAGRKAGTGTSKGKEPTEVKGKRQAGTSAKAKEPARKAQPRKAAAERPAAPVPQAAKARRGAVSRRAAEVRKPPAAGATVAKAAATAEEGGTRAKVMPLQRPTAASEAPFSGADRSDRSGKYVYCIIHTTDSMRFGPIGIGSEPAEVHTVNYKDIAAVVSDTPLEVYDPTRENVLAHERVNETVMRDFTVIPMSFNTVFKTSEDIVELLRTAYDAFRDVLGKMEDKVEFGLKVLWEPELVIREIEKENENLRLLRHEISSQRGSTYFARMQYGRLVDSLLQDRCDQLVAEIFGALSDVSIASRANKPIGDKMILNAAFLVDRDREGDFDLKVKEVDTRYENLKFKYTGPWPPYNFVNIRLKLERAAEE